MKKTAKHTQVVTARPINMVSSKAMKERAALIALRNMDNSRFEKKSAILIALEAALQNIAA